MGSLGFATPAWAGPVPPASNTFNFNNNNGTGTYNGVTYDLNCACNGGNSSMIQSYMTNVLLAAGFVNAWVTVTGAVGQMGPPSYNSTSNTNGPIGGITYNSYNGEGRVVSGPNDVRPLTLGDTEGLPSANTLPTDGYYDNLPAGLSNYWADTPPGGTGGNINSINDGYIKNCTGTDGANCSPQSDRITIKFQTKSGPTTYNNWLQDISGNKYLVDALKLDYQIFPDVNCPGPGTACTSTPDLKIYAGSSTTLGNLPLRTYYGTQPSGAATNSPTGPTVETAFQAIGVTNLITGFDPVANSFEIVDWPATIAMDNVYVGYKKVPEPGTLAMFAFGLLGLAKIARRRRTRSAA